MKETRAAHMERMLQHQKAQQGGSEAVSTDYADYKALKTGGFRKAVHKYHEAAQQCAALEKAKKELSREIQMYFDLAGLDPGVALSCAGVRVSLVKATSASTLDRVKLVELGVTAKILEKATKPGSEYTYVRVSEPKEE